METTEARKKDTRDKIALGGLIAKVGLRYEKRALLLGLLIDARQRLKGDEAERARLTEIGEKAFGRESD
ncbi:MAG: conjugal transfer protein TraD [Pseudaminobacter sp.]|jgi:hypothetical protein|uniref:Conjugal transfer protein TraD n=1 Tax=Aquamicrobium defluvii TaxID=69279 RepID=A0A011V0X8_9HYPH|nr:conjugal transfer protein TraD [Aquamicrobium defluvii]EXL02080.1 conjugal transfer protein TraD [Aquamicrobium defluvii]EZQ12940.1 conjugal transfer protein TraD [Halopseudomonas bauzanensis]